MNKEKIDLLREYWQAAPREERYALKITASLFERDIEPEIREIRLAAHKRRFNTQNYTI